MEFSILKDILKPKVLAGFVQDWQPEKTLIEKYLPELGRATRISN
jgi:hypothetical protein